LPFGFSVILAELNKPKYTLLGILVFTLLFGAGLLLAKAVYELGIII